MTNKPHYRLYVINKLPQLRVLDFQRIKQRVSSKLKLSASHYIIPIHLITMQEFRGSPLFSRNLQQLGISVVIVLRRHCALQQRIKYGDRKHVNGTVCLFCWVQSTRIPFCCSRKYPYLPHGWFFRLNPLAPLEIPL